MEALLNNGWTVDHGGAWSPEEDQTSLDPDTAHPSLLPRTVWREAKEIGLPNDEVDKTVNLAQLFRNPNGELHHNEYILQVGPVCIFALLSCRVNGPHWSDIALAVYYHYETEDLRYVFRVDVVNDITRSLVTKNLYSARNGLRWPDIVMRAWRHDIPEYTALWSTPNARGVAGLVLGGFTKYVPEIVTWADRGRRLLQMLFVIADI